MGGEPRIGVYVCHCGSNIAGTVDVEGVTQFARSLDSVVIARDYRFMCSDPGQNLIKQDIQELGLNRVVVAIGQPAQAPLSFSLTIPSFASTSSTSPPSDCKAGLTRAKTASTFSFIVYSLFSEL